MSKYAPFGDFLTKQKGDTVPLSFHDVEKTLGFKLPDSAYGQRAWWSNNPNNNVMTMVWRKAGFRTQHVDMKSRKVVFQRQKPKPPSSPEEMEKNRRGLEELKMRITKQKQTKQTINHPLRGALKGVLRLVGGTDLTKPADPNWGAE
ncbi:MAG TPA: hypothetical protein VJ750_03600 [Rhizomicrobium sp.]|nr:hypothetical protein [Rhizomicrobium sp.]